MSLAHNLLEPTRPKSSAHTVLDDLIWYDIASIWLSNPYKFINFVRHIMKDPWMMAVVVDWWEAIDLINRMNIEEEQLLNLYPWVLSEILSSQAASGCYDNVGPILR